MNSDLPHGWSSITLGQVTTKLIDGSHNPPPKQEHGLPMLSARNIENGKINFSDFRYIDKSAFEVEDNRTKVRSGDVLLTTVGAIGRATTVPENIELFTLQRSVAVLSPIGITPELLMYQLRSPRIQAELLNKAKGTAQKGIYLKKLSGIEITIPPLNEQRRIVAKIEALKARSQRVKEELEAIAPLLDQFRQSVLAAAFRGDLTADWREKNPDVEPASVLLERIRAERRRRWEEAELEKMKANGKTPKDDKWKEKYREPELSNQSNLPNIPKEWLWTTMDEIADIDLGKMLDRGKEHKGKLFPYLRNINVRWGYIDLTDLLEMDFSKDEVERFSLKKNDVLVCEGGEPGRSAIWEGSDSDIKYQKTLHRVRPFLEIPPLWFVYHLKLDSSRGILENYFSGSTIKHFTKISFQKYAIRLASLEEQKEIIRRIKSLFKAANKIQQQYKEAQAYCPLNNYCPV